MSTGGGGIPRLQELSYLEVVVRAVAEEATFEEVRRGMVEHMIKVGEASPGTGNIALFRNALTNPKRYVRNVTEALKELMRLGLVAKATLPSSASSAYAYKTTTFALTPAGEAWVQELVSNRRRAYDLLCNLLLEHHPQFGGFLRIVGALAPTENSSFTIPLLRWGDVPKPRTREAYLAYLAPWVARGTREGNLGWEASEQEIVDAVRTYAKAVLERAEARERPQPFARNRDFTNSCEEALVKLAFTKAGTAIDYISVEILRRWTRTLGLVNFSYHTPGPNALRFWPTATVTKVPGSPPKIERRVGPAVRDQVLESLKEAFELARRIDPAGSAWVPIYRVRAALCWSLKIPDTEFDAALEAMLRNECGTHLPFGVHLDQASYGNIPPSERPLVLVSGNSTRIYKSMSLIPRAASSITR